MQLIGAGSSSAGGSADLTELRWTGEPANSAPLIANNVTPSSATASPRYAIKNLLVGEVSQSGHPTGSKTWSYIFDVGGHGDLMQDESYAEVCRGTQRYTKAWM